MRFFFFLFFLLPVELSAQQSSITIQKYAGSSWLNDSFVINYPIIITSAGIVDHKINGTIKKSIFGTTEDDSRPMDSIVQEAIFDWLTGIDYKIYFNSNNILSVLISAEGLGAYPYIQKHYFNFNLSSGEEIKITDIISEGKLEEFKKKVRKDKFQALTSHKNELRQMLQEKEIDQETFNWAEEYMSYCFESLDLENFIITKDYIQVFDECEFPRAVRNLSPDYELKYPVKDWANKKLK